MCYFLMYVLTIAKSRANVWPVNLVVSAGGGYVVNSFLIAAPIVYECLCFVLTVSEVERMFDLKC